MIEIVSICQKRKLVTQPNRARGHTTDILPGAISKAYLIYNNKEKDPALEGLSITAKLLGLSEEIIINYTDPNKRDSNNNLPCLELESLAEKVCNLVHRGHRNIHVITPMLGISYEKLGRVLKYLPDNYCLQQSLWNEVPPDTPFNWIKYKNK